MELQNIISQMVSMPDENCGMELKNGRYAQIYKTRKPYQNREWPKYVRMAIFSHKPSNPDKTMMGDYGKLEIWLDEKGIEHMCTIAGYWRTDEVLSADKIREIAKQYRVKE